MGTHLDRLRDILVDCMVLKRPSRTEVPGFPTRKAVKHPVMLENFSFAGRRPSVCPSTPPPPSPPPRGCPRTFSEPGASTRTLGRA